MKIFIYRCVCVCQFPFRLLIDKLAKQFFRLFAPMRCVCSPVVHLTSVYVACYAIRFVRTVFFGSLLEMSAGAQKASIQ